MSDCSIQLGEEVKTCSSVGTDSCEIGAEDIECICICGFDGEICDDRLTPEGYNLVLGFFLGVGVIFLGTWQLVLLEKANNSSDNRYKLYFVNSRLTFVSPIVLLVYRVCCLIIYLPVMLQASAGEHLSFSLINFNLLGFIFILGCFLSIRALVKPFPREAKAGCAEYLFVLIQSFLLPSACFLTIVFWVILVPGQAGTDLFDELIEPRQFFVHGVNVVMLTIEFWINDTFIPKYHFILCIMFAGAYGIFHQLLIVYYEASGEAPCNIYGFMNMASPIYVLLLVGLLLMFGGVFFVFYKLSEVKRKYSPIDTIEKSDG